MTEQHEPFQVAATSVHKSEMQQELHPVHFPHILHAAKKSTANIDIVCKPHREAFARRQVKMPINFLVDVDFRFENRIKHVSIFSINDAAIRYRESNIVIVLRKPVKKTVPHKSANTVQIIPCRKYLHCLDAPE